MNQGSAGGPGGGGQSLFQSSQVAQFFPTCVWIHRLARPAELNAALLGQLATIRAVEPSKAKAKGTWQSAGDLHRRPGFETLAQAAMAAGQGVVGFLQWKCEGLEITNLWANINFEAYAHHQHNHPNNHLSGVYYAKAAPGAGDIIFYDPRPQAHLMEPAVVAYTPPTVAMHRFKPEEGLLLLFPSWLEHSVDPNLSGQERVSLAFNFTLRGRIGLESGEVVL